MGVKSKLNLGVGIILWVMFKAFGVHSYISTKNTYIAK